MTTGTFMERECSLQHIDALLPVTPHNYGSRYMAEGHIPLAERPLCRPDRDIEGLAVPSYQKKQRRVSLVLS
jgi:hypothetical protein